MNRRDIQILNKIIKEIDIASEMMNGKKQPDEEIQ